MALDKDEKEALIRICKRINRLIGVFFTAWGFYFFCKGDLTNGLLSMILGELIDVPKKKRG